MLSHACACCGKPLDAATRSYAPSVAMWIARCPRCGTAVRWNVRHARAPFRLWARTRALNLRLGIALGAGQLAGLLASIYAAIIGNEAVFYGAPLQRSGEGLAELLALVFLLGGFMALAAGVSAVNFAPHRGLPTRLACAWLLGALPVPLGLLVLGMTPQPDEVRLYIRNVLTNIGVPLYLAYLSIPVVMSVVFAVLIGAVQGTVLRRVMRHHFRANAARLRGLSRSRGQHSTISRFEHA